MGVSSLIFAKMSGMLTIFFIFVFDLQFTVQEVYSWDIFSNKWVFNYFGFNVCYMKFLFEGFLLKFNLFHCSS